jgi:hypothetical protein
MTTIYVVDTSYLLEYANCDDFCVPTAVKEVRRRFKKESARGARFFVPLPCIFELGNHIADVKHNARRAVLAAWLVETVSASLAGDGPFHITPAGKPSEIFPELMKRFEGLAAKRSVGLVDSFTITEAERLKARKLKVHIWTNDRALKDHEPDREPDPYLWKADGSPA